DKSIAGILLASIISDTLNLTSSTATSRDEAAVLKLLKLLGLDRAKFVEEQFRAKSSLGGMTIKDVVNYDAKDFDLAGKKIRIGVFETTDPAQPLSKKEEIKSQLLLEKEAGKYDYYLYFVVDILKGNASPIILSDQEKGLLAKSFGREVREGIILEGVVSRKKQIVPKIAEALKA